MDFFISVPFSDLDSRLDQVVAERFYPEVRMTSTDFLLSVSDSYIDRMARRIEEAGVKVFTHGPFFGLDIASMDSHIGSFSADCLARGVEVTGGLGGDLMVIHTGYLPFFSRGGRRHWFRNWARRIQPLIEIAEKAGVTIALENTWDDRPEILLRLRSLCRSDRVKFCLDTGHVNCFSRIPLSRWWTALGDMVEALHLHDNRGDSDDHMVPGKGTFDFEELAGYLRAAGTHPKLDLEVSWHQAAQSRDYLTSIFQQA
ncbi:MAG: TIM barrel protein [Candidatus Latescibacteria bacterium]|nr:TIM barrel protein [bacterium]MBD3423872.1 TIM barrel protein [Candidatus Latescibacterota bacterium]